MNVTIPFFALLVISTAIYSLMMIFSFRGNDEASAEMRLLALVALLTNNFAVMWLIVVNQKKSATSQQAP